jgi:RNA polymerase sigma factor (TIGR02999 family)
MTLIGAVPRFTPRQYVQRNTSVETTMTTVMITPPPGEVTRLLNAWRSGDAQALERLTPLVYDHLRRLGRQYVRKERADVRGDATSLVHQAFVRLIDARAVDWHDRAHFLAVCSQIMRRVLVDAARTRAATKRGGGMHRVDPPSTQGLDGLPAAATERALEMCTLDDALEALARREPRRARVIELRFFGGLSVEETADTLHVSPQTVMRDWKLARAWLAVELKRSRAVS